MIRNLLLILLFGFLGVRSADAQDVITIINPSFEDIPRQGGVSNFDIRGWFDCGSRRFEKETPPDVHPGNFWSVNLPPSDGYTYLGLVVRDNDTYEGLSQRLGDEIQGGKCYVFSIDLARSEQYVSRSRQTDEITNYVKPTVLRVWGGSGYCNDKELLAESIPITHSDWRTYDFKIKSKGTHRYILIEAYYKTPTFLPYCGHLLLDNLSNIVEVPCDESQVEEVTVVVPTKPNDSKLPPHKQGRVNQAKVVPEKPEKEEVKVKKPKLLTDLDIKKIRRGSTVEIKNLYFDADTSTIDAGSYEVLDEVYDFLNENRKIVVEIGGHTNGLPTHKYCDKLSTMRAKAVYDYLIDKGIKKEKITYKGYGKRRRIASDRTEEGRRKNQRVEITILSLG